MFSPILLRLPLEQQEPEVKDAGEEGKDGGGKEDEDARPDEAEPCQKVHLPVEPEVEGGDQDWEPAGQQHGYAVLHCARA